MRLRIAWAFRYSIETPPLFRGQPIVVSIPTSKGFSAVDPSKWTGGVGTQVEDSILVGLVGRVLLVVSLFWSLSLRLAGVTFLWVTLYGGAFPGSADAENPSDPPPALASSNTPIHDILYTAVGSSTCIIDIHC